MATFKEQYESLFGESLEFDPVKPSPRGTSRPTPRLALDISGDPANPVEQNPDLDEFLSLTEPAEAAPVEGTRLSDYPKAFGAGVTDIGALGLGAVEYGARQAGRYHTSPMVREIFGGARDLFQAGREGFQGWGDDLISSMTPEAQDRIVRQIDTLDPEHTMWQGSPLEVASTIGLKLSRMAPPSLATLVPGAVLMRAGMTSAAITSMGASEAVMSIGGIQNGIADEINSMSEEELIAGSPQYASMIERGEDPSQARQKLIAEAQEAAPVIGGLIVGAIGATTGRFLEPVFARGGGNIVQRFGRGYATEAPQEGSQGAAEQLMQNIAAQVYDADRSLTEGVRSAALEEGALGGIFGGGVAALAGRGPEAEPAQPATRTALDVGPAAPFSEVFGEGGEDPLSIQTTVPSDRFTTPDELEAAGQQRLPLPDNLDDLREQRVGEQLSFPLRQPERLPAVSEAQGQRELPLTRRARGYASVPDAPSAEPTSDIEAQLIELMEPDSQRQAVYLSSDNLAVLDPSVYEGVGVPLEGFDGNEGVLIAKNEEIAQQLEAQQDRGVPLQEILGVATGAGTGKPADGSVAVQRRDEAGNVLQESLVSEAEADALTRQWQSQHPDDEIVTLSPEEVIERREGRISEEAEARTGDLLTGYVPQVRGRGDRVRRQQRQRARQTDELQQVLEDEGVEAEIEGGTTPSRTAARVIGEAVRQGASEGRRRISSFYPTEELEFSNDGQRQRYAEAFDQLVEAELTITSIEQEHKGKERPRDVVSAYSQATEARKSAMRRLARIRTVGRPKRRSERVARAAAKVDQQTATKLRQESARARDQKEVEGSELTGFDESDFDTDFASFQPGDVDNMHGATLDEVFAQAAAIAAGRERGTQLTYQSSSSVTGAATDSDEATTRMRSSADLIPEGAEPVALKAPNEKPVPSLEELFEANNTDAKKRVFIRRMIQSQRRRKYGGKSKASKIPYGTIKRKTAKGGTRQEARGFFDSGVLTRETAKGLERDESVSNRLKREERSRTERNRLRSQLDNARQVVGKFESEGFQDVLNETDEIGNPTEQSFKLRFGRAYYRQIAQFGEALLNSEIDTTEALDQMAKVSDFLDKVSKYSATQFADKLGSLVEAAERESLNLIGGSIRPQTLQLLKNPAKRLEATLKTNDAIRRNIANAIRLNEIWRKNDLYNSAVGPLMEKITDSTARDGYPSYVLRGITASELEALNWALKHWNKETMITRGGKDMGTFRDQMYKPIRRFFKDLGFDFDKEGQLVIETEGGRVVSPLAALNDQYRALNRGAEAKRSDTDIRSKESIYTEYRRNYGTSALRVIEDRLDAAADAVEDANRDAANRKKRAETPGRDEQINRVISQFLERVGNPRLTVPGLIRQEQRLIRAFKELGIWRDTPSPVVGRVVHPTTGVEKTISIVGPRLEAKKLSKPKARKLMQNLSVFRLPKTDADIREEVTERAQQKLNAEMEFFNKQVAAAKHGDAFIEVSAELRGLLNESPTVNGHALLDAVLEGTPEGHPYHQLATRLRTMGVANLPVRWSGTGDFALAGNVLGKFRVRESGNNSIMLNRNAITDLTYSRGEEYASAATIHTLLHEMTHAATVTALRTDRSVRQAFTYMQAVAKRHYRNNGYDSKTIPYGLRADHPVEEFVAEAFSNQAFQAELKEIKFENTTLWQKLVGFVRQLIGLDAQSDNLLDLVMATADAVFVDTPYKLKPGETMAMNLEDISDPVAARYVRMGDNLFRQDQFRRIAAKSKWAGVRAPLNLMTLNQIRDTFKERLAGLDQYYRAFKRRDARNSELLEGAEKLSREWTSLTEKDPAQAVEFSYLATQATINDIHPDKPLSDPANKHVTEPAQKKIHSDLSASFNQLPEGFKSLWHKLQRYYNESLVRESKLLTQNALRAVLTKGANAPMTKEMFEKTFPISRMDDLDTQQKLTEELGDYLEADTIGTIVRMRTLAEKRTGPYFPIMRYGDYVVEALKTHPAKSFGSMDEARAWREAQLAEDPTLEIAISKADDGTATAVVKEKVFLLAESPTEAQLKREELLAEGIYDKVSAVTKKLDYTQAASIPSNSALGTILDQLKDNAGAQAAIRQYYLRSLADSSFRKHEIKRKNRRGYDSKLQHRNFTNYAQAASYYTAQLEHGWQMADAMEVMREDIRNTEGEGREGVRKSEVYEQLSTRDKRTANPMEVNKLIRNGVSFAQFTMLTSPSYWMINATQPYMVSLPYMAARHGLGQSSAALINAQKLIAHPLISQAIKTKGGLSALFKGQKSKTEEAFNVVEQVKDQIRKRSPDRADEIIKMLDELRRESILDLSWIAELRDISEGRDTGTWQKVLDSSRIMSHLTEVNNRILTAIAAYNLASATGSQEDAIEYAKEVVAGTHFDYSSGAKPLLFRPDGPLGAAAPLVFQFMQWPQHMYAMLISNMVKVFRAQGVERTEAAKILGGLIGTHLLAGGVVGAMLQPIKWAFGLAMMALGDDEEPYTLKSAMSGDTFDRYVQEGIANIAGPGVAELLARGAPAALGTDLSDRMSLGTLYFFDLRPESMESTLGSLALSVGGPWLTIGESAFRGMQDIVSGDVLRGVERVSPKVLRDMLKTYRYASDGLVNTRGDTVLDGNGVPPLELFLQSIGFSSATVSNFYNRQSVIKDTERFGADRRQALIDRFATADRDGRRTIIDEVNEFNKAFPAARITRSTLLQSVRGKSERERSYERFGANLRGDARAYADEGWYFQ